MCTNKRYIINPYNQKRILVPCGHCDACLQQKALHRTNRIKNNMKCDGSELPLFITLTYSNDFIPYIKLSDILTAERYKIDYDSSQYVYDVPVYRNKSMRHFKGKKIVTGFKEIDKVTLDDSYKPYGLKSLRGLSKDCIGICYYKDLQNFIKRLKINLHRNGIQNNFSFYACSEYGPQTCRPHFHLLLWSTVKDFAMWQSAVASSWSYDSDDRARNSVEIARKPSSYVASYVNCSSTVPLLLRKNPQTKPTHSYSKGFGVGKDSFSLVSLLEKIRNRDLHYLSTATKDGVTASIPLLFPKYVISRYFPKFLGYSRLADDEIRRVCCRPSTIFFYASRIGATNEQLHQIEVSLTNSFKRFNQITGYGIYDFAITFVDVWNLYLSTIQLDNLKLITTSQQNIYAYDNIKDYFNGMVKSASLDSICSNLDLSVSLDPNEFPKEQQVTNNLISSYASYSKDRKIRNQVYSQFINV